MAERHADVTGALSRQVLAAIEALLAGLVAADARDGTDLVGAALGRGDSHLYAGLLAAELRLLFLLCCEDRALLPVEHPIFAAHYGLHGLFARLDEEHGRRPDALSRRYGAYPGLLRLFRLVFNGARLGELDVPARGGALFDPDAYPFLEGRAPGDLAADPAALRPPSVDDLTVHTMLHRLHFIDGQAVSHQGLGVEQIGSVYEVLMGFEVQRLASGAVRVRLGSKGSARAWVEAEPLLRVPGARRPRWLQDELGLDSSAARRLAAAVAGATTAAAVLTALEPLAGRRPERAAVGALVVQPGHERRRTSSHYTPRELTEPMVARMLGPLVAALGDPPASDALLGLSVCDPAMGSGAFLIASCRYLADQVVAAWTREGKLETATEDRDDVVSRARRLVAQRCLYGVDKNEQAVRLARLSLWLVTRARDEPFTFVDHSLCHGDSLVGLDLDQLRAFHWRRGEPAERSAMQITGALAVAVRRRRRLREPAARGVDASPRDAARLLADAEAAVDRARLLGDLIVGAFFDGETDAARQRERDRRLAFVERWLAAERAGEHAEASAILAELRDLAVALRRSQTPFHWGIELPEVFLGECPGPVDLGTAAASNAAGGLTAAPSRAVVERERRVGSVGALGFDAVVGNPPWILYVGRGSQPLSPREKAFLEAVHGRAAKTLSTHGLFAAVAGRLVRPGGRVGLVLPTSVADASRYADVRGAHDELCAPDPELPDLGEDAFMGVFQPCMALLSTRRTEPCGDASGAPWPLARAGLDPEARRLLAALEALPKLPPELFGERGYRSSARDRGKFVKAGAPVPPHVVPLYEGTSVRELELLPPTAYADGARLPVTHPGPRWAEVDFFIRQTARFPIASPSARLAFRNSILAGFARGPYTTGALVAYLNATPVRWYHYHRQRDAQQGMPQVKIGHLRALPAPGAAALEPLDRLGSELIARNRGITGAERSTLDGLVAEALGVRGPALARVLAWGRAHPPPAPRARTGRGSTR